jgi:hypothetical protein
MGGPGRVDQKGEFSGKTHKGSLLTRDRAIFLAHASARIVCWRATVWLRDGTHGFEWAFD